MPSLKFKVDGTTSHSRNDGERFCTVIQNKNSSYVKLLTPKSVDQLGHDFWKETLILSFFFLNVRQLRPSLSISIFLFWSETNVFARECVFVTLFFLCSCLLSAQYPSFLSEPSSLVQSRGSVARLRCLVSPSSAEVSWRFRGLPLDLDTLPGVELSEGSLTISSLKPGHVGVYQCVARLEHGPAVASRHARVAIAGTDVENYACVRS